MEVALEFARESPKFEPERPKPWPRSRAREGAPSGRMGGSPEMTLAIELLLEEELEEYAGGMETGESGAEIIADPL